MAEEPHYIPTGRPLTPHEQELLHILCEEAAEVIQEACKVLRFGPGDRPSTGVRNTKSLALEIGDFARMVDAVKDAGLVLPSDIADGYVRKSQRLPKYQVHPKERS